MASESFPQTLLVRCRVGSSYVRCSFVSQTLLLPFSISLALFVLISYVLVPMWQRQRENLPLDTISDLGNRFKYRIVGLVRRRERDIEAWDDDEVGAEEGDGILRFEQQRESGIWRGR